MSERLSRKWNAEFQVTYLYSYLQPDTSYFNQHLRIWNSLSSELTRAEFINRGEFAARLIICCFVRWNARGRKHACCARKNNAKLLLDMENSVKRKRVYGIDSHCNGRIKVSTLRYLGTFHPAVRIRLIYLFIFFFCSSSFLPPPSLPHTPLRCWFVAAGCWWGENISCERLEPVKIKVKPEWNSRTCVEKRLGASARRVSAENACVGASIDVEEV